SDTGAGAAGRGLHGGALPPLPRARGRGRLKRAIQAALLAATLLGAAWLLRRLPGGLTGLFSLAADVRALSWVALVMMAWLLAGLDGLRTAAPLRLLGHRVSIGQGVRLTWISTFVSSLTPVAELHVPAM